MISFDEAVELIRSIATPLGTETVPIAEAAGRVLARPVTAGMDSPRSDVSAMDGYAVREDDLDHFPALFELVGGSYAGSRWDGSVTPGTCVRIFTGAPVPEGADRVVIQEKMRSTGSAATIDEHPGDARHIRKRGSDFVQGEELLLAGRSLDPRALVAAAGADVAELEVYRMPRLHILSTGDELADPGSARERADAIPESVSFGVAALAAQWGAECLGRTRVGDDLPRMQDLALAAIDDADLVVVTGGASVGERDFARATFEPLGLELVFSKVSIKPGKPVWLGRVGEKLVLGLPGNPTSALVTARLLLAPLLAGMAGRQADVALSWRNIPLRSHPLGPCGARETFHRARSVNGASEILSFQDSSAQKALAQADLLVRQRANSPALEAGAEVEVLDF
jgi:molybdopterin molybdotransferase